MIQVTPQMQIWMAVAAVDYESGIQYGLEIYSPVDREW